MRAILLLATAALLGACAGQPSGEGGIVSTNPCADAMLVALVPPERIRAISHYSHDARATSIPLDIARQFPATAGTAEEIIAMRPELVVASSFTPAATRAAFAEAGLHVLYQDIAGSIAASEAQVAALAEATGNAAAGARLNARIDAAVARARSDAPPVPALLWISGNLVSGGGTLLDELMRVAGFRNAAADYGLQFTGTLPIEHVVADPPRVLLVPQMQNAGRAADLRSRAVAAAGAQALQAEFPRHLVNCGGPVIVSALDRLAAIRREVAP